MDTKALWDTLSWGCVVLALYALVAGIAAMNHDRVTEMLFAGDAAVMFGMLALVFLIRTK